MPIHHHITYAIVQPAKTDRALSTAPIQNTLQWQNWTGNVKFTPTAQDGNYYYLPNTFQQLQSILQKVNTLNLANRNTDKAQIKVRVSGQRHSATPLVANEDLNNVQISTPHGSIWLVDLACYHDLGPSGKYNIALDRKNSTVTVNTGVSETELEDFLSTNGFMLNTVTAGGFFSIGGMTAVDVHGSAVNQSIFSASVVAYTVLGADGKKVTINEDSPQFDGYNPLQFYRTSLGTLGIVTSVTLKVTPRPYKNTLVPSDEWANLYDQNSFVQKYSDLLFNDGYDSVESFFNPYVTAKDDHFLYKNLLILKWKIDPHPAKPIPNSGSASNYADVTTTADKAKKKQWGAPLLAPGIEQMAESIGRSTQQSKDPLLGKMALATIMSNIKSQMSKAVNNNQAMWLASPAERALFMSYFIPLPNNKDHGLDVAWKALQVITNQLKQSKEFITVLPPEFRFVRGSDALLSGTYTKNKNQLYISIEILALVNQGSSNTYPTNILDYFASVEKQWVAMGGFPHNGKAFGFYNPELQTNGDTVTGVMPFNPHYVDLWKQRKKTELEAFAKYQKHIDPTGLFCNNYTYYLGVCSKNN